MCAPIRWPRRTRSARRPGFVSPANRLLPSIGCGTAGFCVPLQRMSKITSTSEETPTRVHHPLFAAVYERLARLGPARRMTDPLRQETAGQADGLVLEVGAGTDSTFHFTS